MFLAPKNLLGRLPPKILDRDYKTERNTEHRAKFRADRPPELGDYAARKKRNHSKTEVFPKTIVFGRTNKGREGETSPAPFPNSYFWLRHWPIAPSAKIKLFHLPH